jgi:hypothetical protein
MSFFISEALVDGGGPSSPKAQYYGRQLIVVKKSTAFEHVIDAWKPGLYVEITY